MTLLNPIALALVLFAIPIILLYVLKLRRPLHRVSSTFLWHRALDDIQANTPWQRLRLNLLLLVQLLIVLALVIALARPAYSETRTFSGDLVVIVDESPGMSAADVAPSRFVAALTQARRLESQLSNGSVMSVMGMAAQPHLVVAESDDHGAISRAIGSLHVGVTRPNFLGALGLASSLARNGEQTRVVVLTSRDSGIRGPPTPVPYSLEIRWLGASVRDLSIMAFHAARLPGKTEATLTVRNFGSSVSTSDLNLYADGQLADVRPLSVAPGQQQSLFWTGLPGGIGRLQARLVVKDDVAFDKTAHLVLPSPSIRRILVVTRGNYWLHTALALNKSFQISSVTPTQFDPAIASGFDLVVFDGLLPGSLPRTAVLLVGPPAGRSGALTFGGLVRGGAVSAVPLSALSPLSSLLQYVDLSDVHVSRVRQMTLPSWMQPLFSSNGQPLVTVGNSGLARVGVIAFDLQNSDWPLRVSYPIVMHNLLTFLAPQLAVGATTLDAGQPMKLYAGSSVQQIDVTRPDGAVDHLRPPYSTFTDTSIPGFYTVRERGEAQHRTVTFATNLFALHGVPDRGPHVLSFGSAHAGSGRGIHTYNSLAWVVALASLGLLSVEWWFAWRR